MLKVFIVDDEQCIRDGLKSVIDWESCGFEVCGEAENGREALKKIAILKPDLVITDIKMPVMNGLDMAGELRKAGDGCKIIVLTAYPDFKFAQKAVELGIGSYIVKPVEQVELMEKVLRARDEIKKDYEKKQLVEQSVSLSRERIIECIVAGDIREEAVESLNSLYGLDFPWKTYQAAIVDAGKELGPDAEMKNRIKLDIDDFMRENNYGYAFRAGEHIGLLLKNISRASILQIMKTLQERLNQAFNISVSISLGTCETSIKNIPQSYGQAYRLMDKKYLFGHKKIIMGMDDDIRSNRAAEPVHGSNSPEPRHARYDPDYFAESLFTAMDICNATAVNDLLEEIRYSFMSSKCDEQSIKVNYANLYTGVVGRLASENDSLRRFTADQTEVIGQICAQPSLHDLHGFIKYRLLLILDELAAIRPDGVIKRILDYIERNYGSDIKLGRLASLLNYNCIYLGKLFKKRTGKHFNAYLDQVRIEKAKTFLKGGMKVYQVAEKVGITDIDYFYKKFKKYTGAPPSSFR